MHKDIIYFIEKFKRMDPITIEDVFLHGNCYWFAQILINRFQNENPELYYLPIDGHFITKINGRFYDISGEVIPDQILVSWNNLQKDEPNLSNRIYSNCALFID